MLSAALLAAMRAEGMSVRAHKPVVTGLDDPVAQWPPDHELLALAAGMSPDEVAPYRYGPAVSPHLASELSSERIDSAGLVGRARAAARGDVLVVEGVGGLMVPLTDRFTVRDLAVKLGLPVLVAAEPGLGTINHTLLTLHGARSAGLDVRAVVLTPWPEHPDAMERSNRETLARLGMVDVQGLPHVEPPSDRTLAGDGIATLAAAGASLPWQSWL